MKKQLRFGVIGLGGRGRSMMQHVILPRENVKIVAVCDVYQDRVERALSILQDAGTEAKGYQDYRKMIEEAHLDAVYIATSWQTHFDITIACLEAGVAVGSEVGCSYSLEECWKLVEVQERTKTPCMMLENCCYGRDEMMILNMIHQGVFGDMVHLRGGYQHDLRREISYGYINRHYRIDNYKNRNCENYPTHELGPISQMLNINHGNRMVSLTSMSSLSAGLHEYISNHEDVTPHLKDYHFAQGDIVTTMIKCAHGETILLTLDTTLPRPYSRGLRIQGTKALFQEDNRSIFIDNEHNEYDFKWKEQYNNIDYYREKYEHPMWKQYIIDGVKSGHDGMDWLVMSAFIDALITDSPMPIDVYDMATWLSISVLSEQSILMGSQPVAIPDFTRGKWVSE